MSIDAKRQRFFSVFFPCPSYNIDFWQSVISGLISLQNTNVLLFGI